jgi:hypothetical protein
MFRPIEMIRCSFDGMGLLVNPENFPDRNTVTHDVSFAAANVISKPNAREFRFAGFFGQVKARERRNVQQAPFGLACQACGGVFFQTAGLDDGRHPASIVYNVNGVKVTSVQSFQCQAG